MKFEISFNSTTETCTAIFAIADAISKFENINASTKHRIAADINLDKVEVTNIPGGVVKVGQRSVSIDMSEDAVNELCVILGKVIPIVLPIYTGAKNLLHICLGVSESWKGAVKEITANYRKKFVPKKHYNVIKIVDKEMNMYISATICDDGLGNIDLISTMSCGKEFTHEQIQMYMQAKGMLKFSNALAVDRAALAELQDKSERAVLDAKMADEKKDREANAKEFMDELNADIETNKTDVTAKKVNEEEEEDLYI